MESAKRLSLGVRKQNKRKNKSLVGYLKSDCYMFAPLFSASPPSSDSVVFPSGAIAGCESGILGFGTPELDKGKKRRMIEKVEEYLKSDYHLYGSMISPPKLVPHLKAQVQLANRLTTEVSTSTTVIIEDGQRTLRSSNVKRDERYSKTGTCHHPRTAEKGKTAKRSLRQRCRSSSLPEGEKLKSSKRRIAIE